MTIHTNGLVGLKSIKKDSFFVMNLKEYSYFDTVCIFNINMLK